VEELTSLHAPINACLKKIGALNALRIDSREVRAGDIFFALAGHQTHGDRYIDEVIQQGAAAVFRSTQQDKERVEQQKGVPIFYIDKLREVLGEIAHQFYGRPSEKLTIIGVTGTNGKTSVCHLLAQALTLLGHQAAVLGTAGNGIWPKLLPSTHTTLDVLSLHKILAEFVQDKVDVVLMEVSSHGLEQGRIAGVAVDGGVFTNLTRDHLDYYRDIEHYARAKRLLFDRPLSFALLNGDDQQAQKWLRSGWSSQLSTQTFGIEGQGDIMASDISVTMKGLQAQVLTPEGGLSLKSGLLGRFNISNLLAVVGVLQQLKVPLKKIERIVSQLQTATGRMQCFSAPGRPRVVVDFAHTPDALDKALSTLKALCHGQLCCVFGCGGDRDVGKRSQMGKIAEKYADKIIVTNDNPRSEAPAAIVADILTGLQDRDNVLIEYDRKQAILISLQAMQKDDVVLIAGKGHESYQIIGEKKMYFSDLDVVKSIMDDERK
jgi:UDP-N-acetylmuramoyl-L-alanyl-D-glutamate--2,6-diaminopimelate ligase